MGIRRIARTTLRWSSTATNLLHDQLLSPGERAHASEVRRWYAEASELRRYIYPLDERSVVFDLGGFKGEWAMAVFARYQCHIQIFEPSPGRASALQQLFAPNPKLRVFPFGLAAETRSASLSMLGEGSSIYGRASAVEQVELRDIVEHLHREQVERVDLMKINIEGGEFEVLPRMIEAGAIAQVDNLLIQFHRIDEQSERRRDRIQSDLRRTHRLVYSYDFVWESWERLRA